jgi:hypothetical protein
VIAILCLVALCLLFPRPALFLLLSLLDIIRNLLLEKWRANEKRLAEMEGREPRDFPPEPRR